MLSRPMTETLHFDRESLARQLRRLSRSSRVAFAASICERMLPRFERFASEAARSSTPVRSVVDRIWQSALGLELLVDELAQLKASVYAATPHADDHPVQSVAGAIDTGSVIYQTLETFPDVQPDAVAQVAKTARDAVEMEILLYGRVSEDEPGLGERIERHPWMQRELAFQARDLASLDQGEDLRRFMLRSRRDAHS
jgi:uncharacterized protein YjaG (DUF416 family)